MGNDFYDNFLLELKKNTEVQENTFEVIGLQVLQHSWKVDERGRIECTIEFSGDIDAAQFSLINVKANLYDEKGVLLYSQGGTISAEKFSGFDTVQLSFYREGIIQKISKAKILAEPRRITKTNVGIYPGGTSKSLESILPTLRKNEAGLYPHEILAIELAPKMFVNADQYQGFWLYQYGIKDVKTLMNSLMNRGFIATGSLYESLFAYDFNVLRKTAKSLGIKAGGTKADIIKRLQENVPSDQLSISFPQRSYVVTQNGKEAIKDDEYVLFIHNHANLGFDIYSLNRLLEGNTLNYLGFIWDSLQQQAQEYFNQGNIGLYRNSLLQMADFMMQEGQFKKALSTYEQITFWDTSGLSNGALNIEISGSTWFPYEKSLAKAAPGIIQRIKSCTEKLEMSSGDFKDFTSSEINKLSSPFHIFTKEEVATIICYEVDGNKVNLTKIYEEAKKRLQGQYPQISFERKYPW